MRSAHPRTGAAFQLLIFSICISFMANPAEARRVGRHLRCVGETCVDNPIYKWVALVAAIGFLWGAFAPAKLQIKDEEFESKPYHPKNSVNPPPTMNDAQSSLQLWRPVFFVGAVFSLWGAWWLF